MLFELHTVSRTDPRKKQILYYDNYKNKFSLDKPLTVINEKQLFKNPLEKEIDTDDISLIKLVLGYSCNYSCDYCVQKNTKVRKRSTVDLDPLIEVLKTKIEKSKKEKIKIQFWGGEPLLYINDIEYIVFKLYNYRNRLKFSMITNGSLLNEEIAEFLIANKFGIGISHDGPGQDIRNKSDFLDDPEKIAILNRFRDSNTQFSFNSVLSGKNFDKHNIVNYFKDKTNHESVNIGEGMFVICSPGDEFQQLHLESGRDIEYRLQYITDFTKSDTVSNFNMVLLKLHNFKESSMSDEVSKIERCNSTSSETLIIDTDLNTYSCQNFGPLSQISKWDKDKHIPDRSPTSRYRDLSLTCQMCPVIHLCKTGCPLLSDEAHDINCRMFYNQCISLFVQTVKDNFDLILYKINIESDNPNDVYILGDFSREIESNIKECQ